MSDEIESMSDALEPCPDCGSHRHKSCSRSNLKRKAALRGQKMPTFDPVDSSASATPHAERWSMGHCQRHGDYDGRNLRCPQCSGYVLPASATGPGSARERADNFTNRFIDSEYRRTGMIPSRGEIAEAYAESRLSAEDELAQDQMRKLNAECAEFRNDCIALKARLSAAIEFAEQASTTYGHETTIYIAPHVVRKLLTGILDKLRGNG